MSTSYQTNQNSTSGSSKRVTLNVPEKPGNVFRKTASIDEEKKPLLNQKSKPENNKAGLAVMLFITFLASVCFSIVLPSIWPFLHTLHASKSMVGWAVAVNSAGSFLASPVFGAWQDKRSTKEVTAITLVLMILGNVMYSLSTTTWLLLIGRFIVGVAAANYAVAQTYISYATTEENRTSVMALNSAANVLGFIIGPSFALFLSWIPNTQLGGVKINEYTSPGYFSAILSLFGLVGLIFLKEIPSSQKQAAIKSGSGKYIGSGKYQGSGFYTGGGSVKDISQIIQVTKNKSISLPWGNICICLWTYFAYTTSFTVFETVGTPFTQREYGWTVKDNSIMYAVLGIICILALVALQIFVRFFNDRVLILGATAVSIMGFGIMTDPFSKNLNLAKFCVGVALCSSGYSTSVAVLISIYSKILKNFDQGMLMGWMSSAGSIARIVGPVYASYTLQFGGKPFHRPDGSLLVFICTNAVIIVTFVILLFSYRRLKTDVTTDIEASTVN